MNRQRIFSGIQPSGNLHIGNYLGAIKQWVELQHEYESIFCVVDLHAITVPQDPEKLREKTIEIAKIYLASGIDPEKSMLFIQSQVHEHVELGWIFNTITKNGDLTKMTQFKDKALVDFENLESIISSHSMIAQSGDEVEDLKQKNMISGRTLNLGRKDHVEIIARAIKREIIERFNAVGVGLFDYPVLMAADILLYDTAVVPVGDDQVQHVELSRTLARRFNKRFGDTFLVPEAKVQKEGARIMGLDNPAKKMSKSAASEYNYIALMDDPDLARKKIMKAVTDSGSEIVYSEEKPALQNLINIYSLLGDITPNEVVSKYRGKGYADFKKDLGDVVAEFLLSFQEKYRAISDSDVRDILISGAKRARAIASAKMREVKERVGFSL